MGSMSDLGLPERQMTGRDRGASKEYVGDPGAAFLQVLEYIDY